MCPRRRLRPVGLIGKDFESNFVQTTYSVGQVVVLSLRSRRFPQWWERVVGVVYKWVAIRPRLHGVGVGDWPIVRAKLAMLFIGVVGPWSGCSHGSAECLADVVWMVFGDMSASADAKTDGVEVSCVRRHLASTWLEELCRLVCLGAKSSEEL